MGLIDNWLRHVQDVRHKHDVALQKLQQRVQSTASQATPHLSPLANKLCELNVIEQVVNVSQTTVAQDAWARGQKLAIHGWIYGLQDGLLSDLGLCVTHPDELAGAYASAVQFCLG
jgi:carbonic anhydrase